MATTELFKVIEKCLDTDNTISGVVIVSNKGEKSIVGLEQLSYMLGKRQVVNYCGELTTNDVVIHPCNGFNLTIDSLPIAKEPYGKLNTYSVVKRYKNGRSIEGFGALKDGKEVYLSKNEAIELCKAGHIDNLTVQSSNNTYIFRGNGISLEDLPTINIGSSNNEQIKNQNREAEIVKSSILNYVCNSINNMISNEVIRFQMLKISKSVNKNNKAVYWRLGISNNSKVDNIDIILNYADSSGKLGIELNITLVINASERFNSNFGLSPEECKLTINKTQETIDKYLKSIISSLRDEVNNYLDLMNDVSKNITMSLKSKTLNGYCNSIILTEHNTSSIENSVRSTIQLKLKDGAILKINLFCGNENKFSVTGIIDNKNKKYSISRNNYIFSSNDIEDCAKNILLSIIKGGLLKLIGATNITNQDILQDKFKSAIKSIKVNMIDDVNNNYETFIKAINISNMGSSNEDICATITVEISNNNIMNIKLNCDKDGMTIDSISNNNKPIIIKDKKIYSLRPLGTAQLSSDIVNELVKLNLIH